MKVEIEMNKREEDSSHVDYDRICKSLGIRYFSYKKEDSDKVAWFLHESFLTTGVSFARKKDMAEFVCNFAARRSFDQETTLVQFAGRQGLRILTTMNETDRAEVARKQAAKSRMRERVADGHSVEAADLLAGKVVV